MAACAQTTAGAVMIISAANMAAYTGPTLSFHEDEFMLCFSVLDLHLSKCCANGERSVRAFM
jgi:hypothetical protein